MDIQGGAGICLGPTNIMGRIYQSIPISITVEGANILTRTLIIFGQGAIVSHPYIQQELHLLQDQEDPKTIQKFDSLFFQHMGFILHNIVATIWYAISNARFLKVPGKQSTRKYYQRITRQSCLFILFTDIALFTLGESLKRREIISGFFADALSNLYLGSAVLKHFHDQGQLKEDLPLMHWSCQQTTFKTNQAFLSLINQIPYPIISWFLKHLLLRDYSPPDNHLTHSVSDILLSDNDSRNRLTEGIYINHQPHDATGRIENAFSAVIKAEVPEKKIHQAQRFKKLKNGTLKSIIEQALSESIISKEEALLVFAAEDARTIAISVDYFNPEQLTGPNSKTQ
jgi:acyl-CoA dehydrogenase